MAVQPGVAERRAAEEAAQQARAEQAAKERKQQTIIGCIVVAIVDGECTVKYLHQRAGRIKLRAANPTYPDIIPRDGQTIVVWGVVSGCVKLFPT